MISFPSIHLITLVAFAMLPLSALAQEKPRPAACTAKALAALKRLPELKYECPEGTNDFNESILEIPSRLSGLSSIASELATFANPAWWETKVADLDNCQVHGTAGELSEEEKERIRTGDFQHRLIGDNQFRLVIVFDPCYQTQYNGSNVFLLYRTHDKVFVSQLFNGYFTRIENSFGLDVGSLNGQPLIGVTSANEMPPRFIYYFFTIDPKTNKAVPQKLFKEGKRLTNKFESPMLFGASTYGVGSDADVLTVMKDGRLKKSFVAFEEHERGKIDSMGQRLQRVIYRWNGRYYVRSR